MLLDSGGWMDIDCRRRGAFIRFQESGALGRTRLADSIKSLLHQGEEESYSVISALTIMIVIMGLCQPPLPPISHSLNHSIGLLVAVDAAVS